ncbi:uncharacterized protein Z519_09948 [Cladophialophora bantiana CBS 173.52]|uniref:Uncharacterized protein n=1 Tax=Cladophialophora bantiana (strain ATCC 10958 / CBS 173.52 / CDC B-1940 / NIH 8579) TaxID=1442370 RepID=A0A0D2EI83_CLAB1|nr:uncharacterized protein Z519_09948 [Cladophialophora bantiana CBS 173.52]KIW89791.1 hypothetical protein Z519_09948 [Cladophialophora bantiana CBS 173.52]
MSTPGISLGLIGVSVDVLITRVPTTSRFHTQASSSDRADGGAQTSSLHADECQDFSVYASLIQSWLYFGLLRECLLRPVDVDSFFKADGRGRQVLNTDLLRNEVDACEARLEEMPAEQARECIANGVKCVSWVKIKVRAMSDRTLASRTEYVQTAPVPGESSRARDHLPVAARARKMNFWRKHGREILPNSLELAIVVLR